MTNSWNDVANAKLFMVLGSNFVENHPGVAQYVNEAFSREGGAAFVVADPRRTRTVVWGENRATDAAFAQIRPGTNGALVCGLMNYAITKTADGGMDGVASTASTGTASSVTSAAITSDYTDYYIRLNGVGYNGDWRKITDRTGTTVTFEPAISSAATGWVTTGTKFEICKQPLVDPVYLYNSTDAPFLLENVDTTTTAVLDYERSGGNKQNAPTKSAVASDRFSANECFTALSASGSVYTALSDRMSHYTATVVADICGITVPQFNALAEIVTAPENRPGTILYAMGATQHSDAAQSLRAYCMLQLLLGNIGKCGGGVNALRGIHNVQGSTDQGVLYSSMPGYSDVVDNAVFGNGTYFDYMDALFGENTGEGLQQRGFINMMHYWFMQSSDLYEDSTFTAKMIPAKVHDGGTYSATGATNRNFSMLPTGVGYNHRKMFEKMVSTTADADEVDFLMCLGQNPAVTEPNLTLIKNGLREVDTLVVVDTYASETATCDRGTGNYTILLPSCSYVEEAGSVTSSARMIQWRYRATPTKGNSRNDLEILLRLAKALDDEGAFDHIDTANFQAAWSVGAGNVYEILYGRQYHPWDAADPAAFDWNDPFTEGYAFPHNDLHPNGMTRYYGDAVAEEVFKQMAAGRRGSTNPRAWSTTEAIWSKAYGALWIYADAYQNNTIDGTYGYVFGGQLSADADAGDDTLSLKSNLFTKMALAPGHKLIVGNYGSDGADGTQTSSGGNWEEVEVDTVGTNSVTLTTDLQNDHYADEPVTRKGAWSCDAQDGIMAKSRAFYDPCGNGMYPRFGFVWLYNRRIFYNSNPCGVREFWTTYGDKNQPGSDFCNPDNLNLTGAPASGVANTSKCRPPCDGANSPATTKYNWNGRFYSTYVTHCETDCPNRPETLGGNGSCKAPGDTHDYIVATDAVCRLFVHHKNVGSPWQTIPAGESVRSDVPTIRDGVQKCYRKYSALADYDHDGATDGTYQKSMPSRFPKHWEPWETPDGDAETTYGHAGDMPRATTSGGEDVDTTTNCGRRDYYPLVLTTWRICWHFQGGPMTRNVPWLAELDPEAYIEINASDAATYGIADGADVYVHTARANNVGPFTARVGTGTQTTQNTKQGVVGIPWHWGKALGRTAEAPLVGGASANEACIDAMETNVKMPESKACLCTITAGAITE